MFKNIKTCSWWVNGFSVVNTDVVDIDVDDVVVDVVDDAVVAAAVDVSDVVDVIVVVPRTEAFDSNLKNKY